MEINHNNLLEINIVRPKCVYANEQLKRRKKEDDNRLRIDHQ